MGTASGSAVARRRRQGFVDSLRDFLTPALWKQAHRARGGRRCPRWGTQPLLLTLLLLSWCAGESQAERFETARACCAACLPSRRRPGRTVQGFHKALARVPLPALRALATGIRRVLPGRLARRWSDGGFVGLGCDGSRLECPRGAELERRLGQAGKPRSAPAVWLTALVHLTTGVPWAWRWGRGTASERVHLRQLLPTLPAHTLLVADAGFFGFDLLGQVAAHGVWFLVRLSSGVWLYTEGQTPLARWREGPVYYWPLQAQRQGRPPLRLRLVRVRGRKADVWLLTNVVERQRLTVAQAATWYRRRWECEGLFRAYKRTLGKMKLVSRTVRLLHREAEGSLLALQLLLAQGALALPGPRAAAAAAMASPRQLLVAVRQELGALLRQRPSRWGLRARAARRERRPRRSPKARRAWPRRKPPRAPKPPHLRKLTDELRALIYRLEREAA